jgi:hypothetical protein
MVAGKLIPLEDTITVRETRELALAAQCNWTLCTACARPMLYRLGVRVVPPETCGRMECGAKRHEGWALRD